MLASEYCQVLVLSTNIATTSNIISEKCQDEQWSLYLLVALIS